MFGSLTRRQRRPLWGWLIVILLFAVSGSLFLSMRARSQAIQEASTDARLAAQTELATLLEPRDLLAPVVGVRALELGAGIDAQITSVGPIDDIRIYSSLGRILYADDPGIVGTRPSYLRDLTFAVASGEAQTQVRGNVLQTLVPIWLSPGGTVVVAELSQEVGPVVSSVTTWYLFALGGTVLLIGAITLFALSSRSSAVPNHGRPSEMPVQVFPAGGAPRADRAMSSPPAVPGREHELERSRRAAEDRAEAAEGNLRGIQKQLKESLARTAELERRLVAAESTTHTSDSESTALRERLSDITERLNAAELDAKAQRQRLALKQQELEEAQGRLASVQTSADLVEELRRKLAGAESRADGVEALQAKLEAAEDRAEEMENEMARMEADLDHASDQFHMTKLSEALRDIDDGIDKGTDGPLEHPVIIRGAGGTGRKVR
jgi:hypothetical protein